ncbi:MAG: hypothetical protein IJU47_00830 [Verrucomicrobia bacterium]|nr:hypothetical protein [Verrucomicrobiota bacterium]
MDEQNNQGNSKLENKIVLTGVIILVASLCAAGGWIKQTQNQIRANSEQQAQLYQKELEQLHNQINEVNSYYLAEANRINAEESREPLDPDYLADQLYRLDNSTDEYKRNKLTFYCLQGFLINGTNALPAVKNLLIDGHNFDLDIKRIYSSRTLRQEIIALLVSMKNRAAADLLSQLLPVAQDAAEMRRLCEALLSISDGYRSYCIKAAREMYNQLASEKAKDSEIKSLRSILIEFLQDKEFATDLLEQKVWCKDNGDVDDNLFIISYKILKDSIIPYCCEGVHYQQEHHKEIEPNFLYIARNHITHPQSAEIIQICLTNSIYPSYPYECIIGLTLDKSFRSNAGFYDYEVSIERGDIESDAIDPEVIQKANDRLLFLDTIAPQYANDEQMTRVIELVRSNLRHTASTDPNKGVWKTDESTQQAMRDLIMKLSQQYIEIRKSKNLE